MMRHKHITLFSFLLVLIVNIISASNTYAYSYMNFGGSLLYVFEDNITITDSNSTQLKTLFQSGNNGIGGYISLGTVASYNAGYEIEIGFTSIKNIKDMQDEVLLSISGPYVFTNYFAQFGTTSPIRPYLGIGAGMMRITADDTVADNNIQNTEISIGNVPKKLKDVIISKKYRNAFAYQGMIGINLVTSSNSMVNLDYRYKASSSPIKFIRTDTEATAEYAYRTHGLNAGLKITF